MNTPRGQENVTYQVKVQGQTGDRLRIDVVGESNLGAAIDLLAEEMPDYYIVRVRDLTTEVGFAFIVAPIPD